MLTKFIELVKKYQSEIILALAVVFITLISFNLGKITAFNSLKTPVVIKSGENLLGNINQAGRNGSQTTTDIDSNIASDNKTPADLTVVASKKTKSKIYHFLWCPGATQIAEKNKIKFANETAATIAGYTLAGNCRR